MKNFSIILSSIAVVLATAALLVSLKATPAGVSADSVKNILVKEPKVVVDALQAYQIQQQEEQLKAVQALMEKYTDEINSDENVPFIGPKDAKVVLVEFFDFSCGYCKRLAPTIEKIIAENNDVKFIFKPLSFVSPVSNYQAKAALAAHKQGKFMEFYKAVLESNSSMSEKAVDDIAKDLGLDFDEYKKALQSEDTANALENISSLAQKVQINGVPTVLINGKHVQTMSADDLQSAINENK